MQPLQNINFKVDPRLKKRIWREATKVPGRTTSQWLRELVLDRLDTPKPPRLPAPSD